MQRAYLLCLEPGWIADTSKFKNVTEETDKFFRAPINSTLEIWDCGVLDLWQIKVIKFFSTTDSRAVACAISSEAAAEGALVDIDSKIGRSLGRTAIFDSTVRSRMIWIQGNLPSGAQYASEFLRNSQSLNVSAFEEINKVNFVADAKGVALIDDSFDSTSRASNLLNTIALACAYQAVLNDAIESLAIVATKTNRDAEKELRRWSRFLSGYYFHEPVKPTTVELIHFYEKIRERQRISIQYQEVTDQLRLLAELVQIDRLEVARLQAEKDTYALTQQSIAISNQGVIFAKQGVAISKIGTGIAIFSLALAFVQFTPKAIHEAYLSWASLFKEPAIDEKKKPTLGGTTNQSPKKVLKQNLKPL